MSRGMATLLNNAPKAMIQTIYNETPVHIIRLYNNYSIFMY